MSITAQERQQFLEQFKQAWPIDRLKSMKLTDYTSVGDKDSLVYWLEFGVGKYLGSIKGGDSSKFGIYERKAEPKGQRDFISSDERYSWKSKYGSSAKEAFTTIKKNILAVIDAVQAGDVARIEALDFESALKWKIAFIYQDDTCPCVIPIYKLSKFKPFMEGQPNYTHAIAYTKLLASRGSKSALEYGFELWQEADSIEGKSIGDFDSSEIEDENENRLKSVPLNQILYGPPGTGKTYETIRAALAILMPDAVTEFDLALQNAQTLADRQSARQTLKARFDRLHNDNHIQFVTFHQSFSYEDFVEGIRAEADEATKQIQYQVVDGVFKSLCELAEVKVTKQAEAPVDLSGRRVWKMSLGNTLGSDAGIYDECIESDYILLGYGSNVDFTGCKTRSDIQACYEQNGISLTGNNDYNLTSVTTFITKMKPGDLVVVSDGNFKFRAIAEITGDYEYQAHPDYDDGYAQRRKVKWLRQFTPSLPHSELLNGQFSQMTLYELKKPSLDNDKLLRLLAPRADIASHDIQGENINNARVIIIDEINRGNISRIFGELITLIEPSKRAGASEELEVVLPYSKTRFKVPSNLYIIGTMNTADRSLAGLDLALRRRFTFIEMPPKPELLDDLVVEGINIGQMLSVMNQRITALLDRDHCIGHAYFMPLLDNPSLPLLADIFAQNILPLLQEYFFEDWQRVRWVLADQTKPDDLAFVVKDMSMDAQQLFPGVQQFKARDCWRLNHNALMHVEAYLRIYQASHTTAEQLQ
ncbi:AAA family ATPase [Alkalimonas sp.]|uniref:AAA family ATPase n=1 Tax=Alkalimonas sp. TaxID=1872453 RepID=UPI00263B0644|nr:AAA family ATPase [Alkalimonas sp.]MCC5825464.1 AAA family ATPase [Alkalimonas sp.]